MSKSFDVEKNESYIETTVIDEESILQNINENDSFCKDKDVFFMQDRNLRTEKN